MWDTLRPQKKHNIITDMPNTSIAKGNIRIAPMLNHSRAKRSLAQTGEKHHNHKDGRRLVLRIQIARTTETLQSDNN